MTDPEGNQQTMVTNIAGQLTKLAQVQTNGAVTLTRYGYLASGERAAIKSTAAVADRFFYDRLGRPQRWEVGTIESNGIARWGDVVYDSYDRMTSLSRDGVTATFTYDALDRMLTRTSAGEVQSFAWDPAGAIGKLSRASNDNGAGIDHEIAYRQFDAFGRPGERRENFDGGATSLSYGYTYDSVGRLDTLRYPEASGSNDTFANVHTSLAGPTVKYNYQNGQLKSLTEVATGNPVLWQATARHALGMVTAATYGGGNQSVTATWAYDPNTLQLTKHDVAGTTSGPTPAQTFDYFTNRNLRERITGTTHETYAYDGARSFLSAYHRKDGSTKLIDAAFTVNGEGLLDMTTSTSTGSPDWPLANEAYTFRSPLQLRQINTQTVGSTVRSFTYDTAGRVTDVLEGANVVRHFEWNSFSLPSRIEYHSPDVTRAFVYTAYGDRARKRLNNSNEVYYAGKLYEARSLGASSESVYRLEADIGVVGELAHPWGGTTRVVRHLFADQQGSPAYQVVNRTSTQLGFFPYGKRQGTPPAQTFSQLGYTGHVQDDDLGLVNMNGRIFDLSSHRFLTRDTVADLPYTTFGTNAYAYVGNNPTNFTDPTGFSANGYPGACAQCTTAPDPNVINIHEVPGAIAEGEPGEVIIEVHGQACSNMQVINGDGLTLQPGAGPGIGGLALELFSYQTDVMNAGMLRIQYGMRVQNIPGLGIKAATNFLDPNSILVWEMAKSGASATRDSIKEDIRAQMPPIGRAVTEAATRDGGHAGKNNPWKVSKGFMAAGYAGAAIGAVAWSVTFGIELNNVEKAYQRGGTEAALGEGIHAGARILGGYAGGALGANAGLATGPAAPIAVPAFTAAGGWAGSRFADGVVTGISQGLRALQARFGDQQLWGL
jgi:RHS repeat-associated protein